MEDLNNPNNLNPGISLREEQINRWNEKPEIRDKGIKAIDLNKRIDISKKKFELINVLAIFGILSLIIIATVSIFYGWILFNDGTMISPVSLICGNTTVEVLPAQPCPVFDAGTCPSCICELTCGNTSYNPTIKIYNSSG